MAPLDVTNLSSALTIILNSAHLLLAMERKNLNPDPTRIAMLNGMVDASEKAAVLLVPVKQPAKDWVKTVETVGADVEASPRQIREAQRRLG